jgi:hypothetical protein
MSRFGFSAPHPYMNKTSHRLPSSFLVASKHAERLLFSGCRPVSEWSQPSGGEDLTSNIAGLLS